jgi:hypothetical protein
MFAYATSERRASSGPERKPGEAGLREGELMRRGDAQPRRGARLTTTAGDIWSARAEPARVLREALYPHPERKRSFRSARLLLVALDDLRIANLGRAWVPACLAERPPLAEEIPALVEPDLDRLEPAVLVIAQVALCSAVVELVLFRNELLDAVVDLVVRHA